MPVKAILLLLLSMTLIAPAWAADGQDGDGKQTTASEQAKKDKKGKKSAGAGGEEEEPECD